jgi:quercetin dioxygenase-like cupin family protein
MKWVDFARGACVLLACGCAGTPLALAPQSATSSKATPLILEENEGERRVIRGWPGHPDPRETFILKVDPKNGGSSHLVFMTANLGPGGEIVTHKHPGADEILFLQTGTAQVQLGDSVREAHAGASPQSLLIPLSEA